MGIFAASNSLVFVFGILGNIVSFVVFLAPLPTFYRVVKKKSTEGFQSIPYVVSLFSAMLWLYYAWEKKGEMLLVTINVFGLVVETIYIAVYMAYSPKQARVFTLRLILVLNFGGYCLVILISRLLTEGEGRVKLLGWICVAFSIGVFVAPLSIIRVVIRTKSVEFMPFPLSFFLTLSAIMWLCYGIFLKDLYVALPNVLGLFFGVLQMALYVYYKNHKGAVPQEEKPQELKGDIENPTTIIMERTETDVQMVKSLSKQAVDIDAAGVNIKIPNIDDDDDDDDHEKSAMRCSRSTQAAVEASRCDVVPGHQVSCEV